MLRINTLERMFRKNVLSNFFDLKFKVLVDLYSHGLLHFHVHILLELLLQSFYYVPISRKFKEYFTEFP